MAPTMNGNPNATKLVFKWEFERFAVYVAITRRTIRSSEQGSRHPLSNFDNSCPNAGRSRIKNTITTEAQGNHDCFMARFPALVLIRIFPCDSVANDLGRSPGV